MSAESPRHSRSGGPLTVPSQPPSDRSIIDAVSGFINDVTLSSSSNVDPKDVIQWARFETADINEPTPEGDGDNDITPLLLILGYGAGVQVWLVPPTGEAQEVLSWRQGTVRVLRILPTPQHGDCFASKRPLIALCDSASPGPTFCSLSFISIRGGEQVKSIKFKNPILDVLANKRSVVVSFSERFAVFDAATLEDRMAITTCYPCPCPLGGSMPINPLALGDRWLAYAEKKLNQSKRSSGGCEGEGVTSYTATVLHAAKSLSKGLRGLGESVAHSLAGGRSTSQSPSPPNADIQQPGVVTIVDIEGTDEEDGQDSEEVSDPIVAHFVAHSEAIIALKFDASGMLLVTADRRGHDFHVFRVNPHPCGPSLASVHHLYILHRGDTTAKVQDIAISADSRWTAISTLRGTTHVFAISPYGGACGVRTHTQPRVVNRLSRFHRSAGLPIHAQPPPKRASGSPVGEGLGSGAWFPNPRLPPYPQPTHCAPLAQLRPTANLPTHTITRTSAGRQRLSSLSEDSNSAPLLARARFGVACVGGAGPRAAPAPVTALYLVTAGGALLHLVLQPRPLSGVPKEKICDESPIELQVESVSQWALQRPAAAADLLAPLPPANPLLRMHPATKCADMCMSEEERWLSQVEIVTHAGPHRRLWMGPQFVFKTYNCTGSSSSLSEAEAVEVDASAARGVARSNPVNMPGVRPIVPVLIDSGSASSVEHSPSDSFRRKSLLSEGGRAASLCDVQLKEDLAEAMKEDHGWREQRRGADISGPVARAVDPAGCVVESRAAPPPPPVDADSYTRENRDEATFRPVVRAPASLPAPAMLLRPLPRATTIPAQAVGAAPPPAPRSPSPPAPRPLTLPAGVVLPAALGPAPASLDHAPAHTPTDVRHLPAAAHPDRPPTLPASDRPADGPARSRLDESPTRKSLGDASGDVSCKLSQCDREREETPSTLEVDTGASLSKCSDKEVSVETSPRYVSQTETERRSEASSGRSSFSVDLIGEDGPKLKSEDPACTLSSSKRPRKPAKFPDDKGFAAEIQIDDEYRVVLPEIVDMVPLEKSSSSMKSSDRKDSKSSVHNIVLPAARRSTERPACPDDEKQGSKDLLKDSLCVVQTEKNIEASTEKISSFKFTDKKEQKAGVRKVELPSFRHSEERKLRDEVMYPAEVPSIDLSSRSLTEKLIEVSSEKKSFKSTEKRQTKSSTRKIVLPSTRRSEERTTRLDDSQPPAEVLPKELPRFTITKKFDEASIDKCGTFVKVSDKKDTNESESKNIMPTTNIPMKPKWPKEEIKTEDQAWDMLLNESEKLTQLSTLKVESDTTIPLVNVGDKSDDPKPKSRKNRKTKKALDEVQAKADENSFVEIHAIEEKQQPSCGDLVSISSPFEVDTCNYYVAKTKKSRSSKSMTPERSTEVDQCVVDVNFKNEFGMSGELERQMTEVDILSQMTTPPKFTDDVKSKTKSNTLIITQSIDAGRDTSDISIVPLNSRKTKSLSPYLDSRRTAETFLDTDVKDVYVIDSTKEEFPEIQITRANKSRKRSPQALDNKEKQSNVAVPVKSWSSIAASKNVKKTDELQYKCDDKIFAITKAESCETEKDEEVEYSDVAAGSDVTCESSKETSLHEKLYELCKRRDIMVAQCDVPSELNFVEEHHSVLHDLPPLEPLNFGLDDFKMEVMRDSLLEANDTTITSPICKINIDDILSSLRETTSKAIKSSTFNLIDIERVPTKKERGFSVIESQKITTQEIKFDDDFKNNDGEAEIMEKSSDDDNTSPIISTDSDKDDKKIGASKLALPLLKQQTKAKKSRRKKK